MSPRLVKAETFTSWGKGPGPCDAHFQVCAFNEMFFPWTGELRLVERVVLERTRLNHLERLVLREVTIDHVVGRVSSAASVLFDRVTLVGPVDEWSVSSGLEDLGSDDLERLLDEQAEVPWAVDLRAAQLGRFELHTVPGDKFLRDPARHFILRKDRLREDTSWRSLDRLLVRRLAYWLEQPIDRTLIVAGERTPTFERDRAWYEDLRARGWAE